MLREWISVLEALQRDLKQEQREKDKLKKENVLARQQLHDVYDPDESKEKMVVTSQDQFQKHVKRSGKQSEKQVHREREKGII